jgi:hypothetical protein
VELKKHVEETQNRPHDMTSNPIFKYLSMLISMKFAIQQRESLALHFPYAATSRLSQKCTPRPCYVETCSKEVGVADGVSIKVLREVEEVVREGHEAREDGQKLKTPPVGIKNV